MRSMGIMSNLVKSIAVIIFGFAMVLLFQNCSSGVRFSSFLGSQATSQLQKDSGNGQGYDGKIRVVHHKVENFTCEGRPQPESILIKNSAGEWQFIQNLPEKCAAQDLVIITGVQYDDTTKIAKFQGKTFTPPSSYIVDFSEDPNLPDVKLLDGVCEDANGKCSFLAALQQASFVSSTAPIAVNLPPGTLMLTNPMPLITNFGGNEISVRGSGAGLSILDGSHVTYHLWLKGQGYGGVTLENITFRNGQNTDLSWASSVVSRLDSGTTNIKNCIFDSNSGNPAFSTGPDDLKQGPLYFYGSQFLNNPNGGFESFSPRFMHYFKDVTMSGNGGNALNIYIGLGIRILNSTFDHNNAGIKLSECGSCLIENSTIYRNTTTGIELYSGSAGFPYDFTISNSTIFQNGSSASDSNLKFGFSQAANKIILNNSILAQNGFGPANCSFTNTHQMVATNSIIDDASCQQTGTSNISINPRLGTLANNGGLTNTLYLLLGSLAIDSGSNALCATTDQRGLPRSATTCDIGAIEIQ